MPNNQSETNFQAQGAYFSKRLGQLWQQIFPEDSDSSEAGGPAKPQDFFKGLIAKIQPMIQFIFGLMGFFQQAEPLFNPNADLSVSELMEGGPMAEPFDAALRALKQVNPTSANRACAQWRVLQQIEDPTEKAQKIEALIGGLAQELIKAGLSKNASELLGIQKELDKTLDSDPLLHRAELEFEIRRTQDSVDQKTAAYDRYQTRLGQRAHIGNPAQFNEMLSESEAVLEAKHQAQIKLTQLQQNLSELGPAPEAGSNPLYTKLGELAAEMKTLSQENYHPEISYAQRFELQSQFLKAYAARNTAQGEASIKGLHQRLPQLNLGFARPQA